MAATAASTFTTNAANYQGVLVALEPQRTPIVNMLMESGKVVGHGNKIINMSKNWTPDDGAQPEITEADSLTAPAETSYVNTQVTNVKQIFHEAVEVSYDKEADTIVQGTVGWDGTPLENDGFDSQVAKHMIQMKLDMEYSIWNGTYQADGGSSATARKMRGISTAITTNVVDAAGADFLADHLEDAMIKLGEAETDGKSLMLFTRPFLINKLNKLFGNQPESYSIGGVNIVRIETPFGTLNLVTNNRIASGEMVIVDFNLIRLEYTPQKNGQFILVEELAKLGMGERAQISAIAGINYTDEIFHAKIKNLKMTR